MKLWVTWLKLDPRLGKESCLFVTRCKRKLMSYWLSGIYEFSTVIGIGQWWKLMKNDHKNWNSALINIKDKSSCILDISQICGTRILYALAIFASFSVDMHCPSDDFALPNPRPTALWISCVRFLKSRGLFQTRKCEKSYHRFLFCWVHSYHRSQSPFLAHVTWNITTSRVGFCARSTSSQFQLRTQKLFI